MGGWNINYVFFKLLKTICQMFYTNWIRILCQILVNIIKNVHDMPIYFLMIKNITDNDMDKDENWKIVIHNWPETITTFKNDNNKPIKIGVDLRCCGRVTKSCSTFSTNLEIFLHSFLSFNSKSKVKIAYHCHYPVRSLFWTF